MKSFSSPRPLLRKFTARLARALAFLPALAAATALAQNAYVNYEGKQTSPIRLSPDGTRLFAVNTPDARLSVFDVSNPSNPILIAEIPVGVEPVSVNPRNNDEVWVVNEVSDSISIVSVSRHLVIDTIYVQDEPADVAFAAGKAFVTAARKNQIAVFDLITHAAITNISVFGENPRALAVSPNGSNVYAAFALSGNRTTLVPAGLAPPQPAPTNGLPAPPLVSLIVDVSNPTYNPSVINFTMPDNDVVELNAHTLAITRYFPRVGTVNFALAVHPVSGDLYVANTEARNLVRFEPVLSGNFVTNRVARIAIGSGAVTNFDLNPGFTFTNFPNLPALSNALAQPTALVFSGTNKLYVAAFGTDRVARIDTNGNVEVRIELNPAAAGSATDPRHKRGPRGLALNDATKKLYVLNRIANTISIIDTTANTVLGEIPTGSFDPTPAAIRQGRGFLYDAKLSGAGVVSCASCHIDAEMDMIAWDLGDPNGVMTTNKTFASPSLPFLTTNQRVHPMKGPMTTQTLRGLNGLNPLHWRGDRTNFLHFNGAFSSLLGGPLLSPADMIAYRDYINTLVFQPNPNQNLNRTYPTNFNGANAVAGSNTFFAEQYQGAPLNLTCTACHTGPPGPGSDLLIFDRAVLDESQDFKVPHLRNIYQKLGFNNTNGAVSVAGFGLTHDGMDPTMFRFLSRPVFGTFADDTTRKRNLEAFVLCFDTGTAPAVGYSRTVTVSNLTAEPLTNDWNLLEGQAAASNIDLIAKGTIDGRQRGLLYQPGPKNYATDQTGLGPFTRAQLAAKISSGDTLNLLGVPPGSGARMAIRRNPAAVLDGDLPRPALQIAPAGTNSLVSWSTNDNGFVLETISTLNSTNWRTETSLRGVSPSRFNVTNSPAGTNRFFRLKGL